MTTIDRSEPRRLLGTDAVALATTARSSFGVGRALPGIVTDVLNFALTLEYLEAEFYTRGVGTAGLIPPAMFAPFDQIRKHEIAHVALLQSVLGSMAVSKPTFDFSGGAGSASGAFADVFRNPATFMALAQAFEDTGVGNSDVLRTALRIHSVEARHAAQVRRMRGQKAWITGSDPGALPDAAAATYEGESNRFQFILGQPDSNTTAQTQAFDETLTKGQVLAIVAPFIAGGM
jgi:hypothetical protein